MEFRDSLNVLFFGFLLFIVFQNTHLDLNKEELRTLYTNEESKFIDISNGFQVHYRDEGAKNSPILVLIHGTASSLHTWDVWAKILTKEFRVIRMDLPGFGLTGPPLSPIGTYSYSLLNFTSFIKEFLDQLGVGSSKISIGGGAISWLYAGQYPNMVENLILVDSLGIIALDHPSNFTIPFGVRIATIPVLNTVMQYFTPRALVEKSICEVFHNDSKVTEDIIDRHFHLLLHEGNREAFVIRTQVGMLEDHGNSDQYALLRKQYKGRTLIQWGEKDIWIGVEVGHRLKKVFENSHLIVYDGAGHIPQEEVPEETVKDVREFLLQHH